MSVETVLCALQKDCSSLPYPIHESAFLAPAAIPFSAEVRRACEANLCGRFGKCWTCPPGVGRWEDLRDHYHRYAHAFVFTTVHPLEDSYDIEGMTEGREQHTGTERAIEKLLFAESEPFVVCGAGGCSLCEKCTYPDAPCRHPELVRHSMEGIGIDVVTLAADCGLHYHNGVHTVTYFSIIFW